MTLPSGCTGCQLVKEVRNTFGVHSTPVAAPAPQVTIVDFVCEDDVRQALQAGRKIYIGPRTIVTPLARELGERSDILVMAERRG